MDKIAEFVKDPSWWFSAFFVAVIASVLAAFLKDWFSKLLSQFSNSYKLYRYKNLRKTVKTIQNIENNNGYLAFFSIRHYSMSILIVIVFISYMVLLPVGRETFLAQSISKIMILFAMIPLISMHSKSKKELEVGLRRYKLKNKLHENN